MSLRVGIQHQALVVLSAGFEDKSFFFLSPAMFCRKMTTQPGIRAEVQQFFCEMTNPIQGSELKWSNISPLRPRIGEFFYTLLRFRCSLHSNVDDVISQGANFKETVMPISKKPCRVIGYGKPSAWELVPEDGVLSLSSLTGCRIM